VSDPNTLVALLLLIYVSNGGLIMMSLIRQCNRLSMRYKLRLLPDCERIKNGAAFYSRASFHRLKRVVSVGQGVCPLNLIGIRAGSSRLRRPKVGVAGLGDSPTAAASQTEHNQRATQESHRCWLRNVGRQIRANDLARRDGSGLALVVMESGQEG